MRGKAERGIFFERCRIISTLALEKLYLNKSILKKDLKIRIEKEEAVSSKILNTKRLCRL